MTPCERPAEQPRTLSRSLALVRWQMRELVPTELPVKRGWSSAPRRLLPRFHRPALAEGSAPGAPPAGAPPPRQPRACLSIQRRQFSLTHTSTLRATQRSDPHLDSFCPMQVYSMGVGRSSPPLQVEFSPHQCQLPLSALEYFTSGQGARWRDFWQKRRGGRDRCGPRMWRACA